MEGAGAGVKAGAVIVEIACKGLVKRGLRKLPVSQWLVSANVESMQQL